MPDEAEKGNRSAWWLATVGVAGAIAGAAITGLFSYLGQKQDADAKMVELSLSILRAPPTKGTDPLREWAIVAIEKHSQFAFNDDQKKALRQQALPYVAASTASAIGSAVSSAIRDSQ